MKFAVKKNHGKKITHLSTSKTFSIELETINGDVIRFSTAKTQPKNILTIF